MSWYGTYSGDSIDCTVTNPTIDGTGSIDDGYYKAGQVVRVHVNSVSGAWHIHGNKLGGGGVFYDSDGVHAGNNYDITLPAWGAGLNIELDYQANIYVTEFILHYDADPPVAAFHAAPLAIQTNKYVQFFDDSTGATLTNWAWDFGDLGTSTDQNPFHQYTAAGVYTVALTVTCSHGLTDTLTKVGYITVTDDVPIPPDPDNVPEAVFSGTPLAGNEPLSVTFTDASTHSPTAWFWDFGDGSAVVNTQNPTHIYDHDGWYTVTLDAANEYGYDTEIKVKYVLVRAVITPPTPPVPPVPPGRLSCQPDGTIAYQLNSSTSNEDSGSQYDHIMALHEATNYDLRARPYTYLYPYDGFDPDTMVITNSAGAWTVNEFADMWVFFVGQSPTGVITYGVIDSNDATTITCSGMCGEASATTTGYILIYSGYGIDFLPDVSQPYVVKNLDINKDCFEYSDNDDKRKLSTKIVATGKDLFGKTISVMVAAVHAYDNDRQMFKDATVLTRRSEGYVYKNTYVINTYGVIVNCASAEPIGNGLVAPLSDYFQENDLVTITATTVPTGLAAGAQYWVKNLTATGCDLSYDGPGGTSISISDNGADVILFKISDVQNPAVVTGALPYVWLYGWGYSVPTGSVMAFSVPNSGVDGTLVTTSGAEYETTLENGTQVTRLKLTKMPVGQSMNFSGRGYLLNKKLWVQDYTVVGNNAVLIGEEAITVFSSGNDATYGHYIIFEHPEHRVTSDSLKAYPHDVGALVARTNYTEASPEATSAITLDGIHIGNFTVDGNITYGQLDTYVTYMLLGLGNFYRMATTWSPLTLGYVKQVGPFHGSAETSLCRPVAVGDRISATPYTGDTPVEYEVVEVTIKCDEGRLLLQLGDFEKNVFTSLEQKTNAVNRTLS